MIFKIKNVEVFIIIHFHIIPKLPKKKTYLTEAYIVVTIYSLT